MQYGGPNNSTFLARTCNLSQHLAYDMYSGYQASHGILEISAVGFIKGRPKKAIHVVLRTSGTSRIRSLQTGSLYSQDWAGYPQNTIKKKSKHTPGGITKTAPPIHPPNHTFSFFQPQPQALQTKHRSARFTTKHIEKMKICWTLGMDSLLPNLRQHRVIWSCCNSHMII